MANETAVSVADPGVAGLLAAYDAAFAADRADEVAELFAEDARLQWPEEEDIVGRDAIRQRASPSSWSSSTPSPGSRATSSPRCTATRPSCWDGSSSGARCERTGEVERVPGRLVLVCRREADGAWRITHALTSRYGETTVEAGA